MNDRAAVAFIGVGSNIDPEEHVEEAIRMLREAGGVTLSGISTFYRTAPLPDPAGSSPPLDLGPADPDPDFLNGVLKVHTDLSATSLRSLLGEIEEAMGRVRPGNRFAPRTMDLDLLLYGRVEHGNMAPTWEEIGADGLLVHSDIEGRPFVTHPLLELAPDLTLPPHGVPLKAFASTYDTAGGSPESEFTEDLRRRFLPG